jgi:hypothetical protein
MRVVTNAAFIQRNRTIAQASFFFSIIVLAASFFFSVQYGNEENGLIFNCIVVPALFSAMLFAVRSSNKWIREPVAWNALPEGLKGVSNDSVLYQYVLPAEHVLFTPQGVFALVPLFHDRPLVIEDDKFRIPGGPFGAIFTFMRQEQLGNPVARAEEAADAVQEVLDEHFPDNEVAVQPVIVFTHPNTQVTLEGEQEVPIVFALSKQSPSLKDFVKSYEDGGSLSPEQIDELDESYIYE